MFVEMKRASLAMCVCVFNGGLLVVSPRGSFKECVRLCVCVFECASGESFSFVSSHKSVWIAEE